MADHILMKLTLVKSITKTYTKSKIATILAFHQGTQST